MDYYLVSVFQNQGLNAVRTICEQGKQKLSMRNDTLIWAIQQQENELAYLLIKHIDVHHDGAMPIRLAAVMGNTDVLENILAVPDQGSSVIDRFEVYTNLVNRSDVSSNVLEIINRSFSDEIFHQLHAKSSKRVQWYMEIAQWGLNQSQKSYENQIFHLTEQEAAKIPPPTIDGNEYYQQAVQLQRNLHKVLHLRPASKKPKV